MYVWINYPNDLKVSGSGQIRNFKKNLIHCVTAEKRMQKSTYNLLSFCVQFLHIAFPRSFFFPSTAVSWAHCCTVCDIADVSIMTMDIDIAASDVEKKSNSEGLLSLVVEYETRERERTVCEVNPLNTELNPICQLYK